VWSGKNTEFDGKISLKILFLGLDYSDVAQESNLYTELIEELSLRGAEVRVIAPALDTFSVRLRLEGGIPVTRVATGRLFGARLVQKALNNLLLPVRYFFVLRKQNQVWQPDWVITPTPPITLTPLVWWLKRVTGARAYLVLRDIFPQNAVDLGFMSRFGLIYGFFHALEKWTYATADRIGCMSPANISYVLAHNPSVDPVKLHELPNWIAERHVLKGKASFETFRASWGVQEKDLLCVFGGNLGKPQQVGFLTEVANLLREEPNIRIVIVGRGTESQSLKREIAERKLPNLILRERLPRDEYQQLLSAADVGFILLNERFTIPNIPSRLTGYWAAGVAVLAATDIATDLNVAFLTKYGGGEWVRMGDARAFAEKLTYYLKNRERLAEMGERGRQATLQHFTAKKAAETVLRQMAVADGMTV
jgi:glycosyltransferase involved in cell wall biosynthesis